MHLDPLILSRLQFVWVIAWHILLPAFTVGVASYIAVLEGLHFWTKKPIYLQVSAFWIRIFSVSFGMGVVSGIIMPFQFGTNWSRFSDATANVVAPLLAYEGLTAFFLEAAFLGVLLFGRKLVPAWAHFVAALMVAFGTLFSSFWILAVNSWMQTPAGYEVVDGRFFPTDWWQVIFNPSFPYRLAHTVVGFYVTTGFVVMGIAAWLIRRGKFAVEGRLMLSTTLWLLMVLVPLQIVLGDLHGTNTRQYQPAKLAAIEGRYDTASPAPLTLFGIPDDKNAVMHNEIAVPWLGSIVLTHSLDGEIKGLKDWPVDQRPPVGPPFFAFRIMVGCGMLMLALVIWGTVLRPRRPLHAQHRVPAELPGRLGAGLHCRAGRVDHDRGRPPALDRLRPDADRGVRDALADRLERARLVHRLHRGLSHHLPRRGWVMARIIRQGPAGLDNATIESGRPAQPVEALPGALAEGHAR